MKDDKSQFREQLRAYLQRLNGEIETVLTQFILYEYPKEVVWIDFVIFSDQFTSDFPIRAFFLDEDNSEYFPFIDGKAEYPSPVDPDMLFIDQVYPGEFEDEFTDRIEDFDAWGLATEETIEWFAERWNNSGGQGFKVAATIGEYGSWRKFDLIKENWIES